MEINKQLFEDILSGKLKGTFVFRTGYIHSSADLYRNYNKYSSTHPYMIAFGSYTPEGIYYVSNTASDLDIINFIPETNMKKNELTIEIPDGKIIDWDESKKQNKIVLKDKQLTYEDICKKLFKNEHYSIAWEGYPIKCCSAIYNANNAATKHQLECILAKNKLATVAKYLNDGWEPTYQSRVTLQLCPNGKITIGEEHTNAYLTDNGQILFKSPKVAQQAIEILGEETVKLALEPLGI